MKEIKARLSAPLETFGRSDKSAAADTTVEIIDIEVGVKVQPAVTGPNTVIGMKEFLKIINEEMYPSSAGQVVDPFDTSFDAAVGDAEIDIDEAYSIFIGVFC
ncbi:unnamed protein product [Tilletia controversa]|nr:unnamed protein product [Tilletia controversa]